MVSKLQRNNPRVRIRIPRKFVLVHLKFEQQTPTMCDSKINMYLDVQGYVCTQKFSS